MSLVKTKRFVLIMILLLMGTYYAEAQLSIKEIIRRISPAVVTIFSYDQSGNTLGFGSGILVTHNGMVVSNYHIIKGAYKASIKIKDGDVYLVTGVVDYDPHRDFIILKIASYDLPFVELGNSNQVEIGDEVIAIGNPKGLEHTVSNGIISQTRRSEGYTLFQITAPISPGSSGGPLINMNSQVIGITTSTILEGQNLNFALPINYVRGVIASNKKVKYTLTNIAKWQAQQDKAEFTQMLSQFFSLYKDPDNFFSMVYPKAWRVERIEGWTEDNTAYIKRTMMAPQDAYRADINGYLSEGIRITFRFPPKGRIWTMGSVEEYANYYKPEILRSNPGFALTGSAKVDIGGQSAYAFSMVGQNENIPEPEKSTFILLANQNYRLIIELVSPTSKLKSYEEIYLALMETFKLYPNIKFDKQ